MYNKKMKAKGNTMVTAAPKELCLLLYILVCKANLEHIKLLPSKHTTEPALSISNSHHQSIQHTDNMSTSTPSNKESTANKTKASAALQSDLVELINQHYDSCFKNVTEFDDFYRALHEIMEKLSESKGAIQLKLPSSDALKSAFEKHHPRENKALLKEEFKNIIKDVITFESFSMGKGALETIFFIFGVPICTFFLKRFIPGGARVSDDILIPAVTSGTVILLAKTNKL
nr:PREDICTED: uncharacterized protein LOC103986784 [Musa acuminata subsp. malaccensis]